MLEVKEITTGFKGLFSKKELKKGEVFAFIEGEMLEKPTKYSIQVAKNKHVECKTTLRYINHSCFPNLKVVNNQFICIKDIAIDDEITFDYNSSEDELDESFCCSCCGKWIRGKNYIAQ